MRNYSNTAAETTLMAGITPVTTTVQVASSAGYPAVPFTAALGYESATEEVVLVTNVAGTTWTVTRAYDGTAAASHNPGERVRHVSAAIDFRETQEHIAADTDVHGLTGGDVVVGEDKAATLSNKILNMAKGTLSRIDIFNDDTGGAWVTTINGDTGTPSSSLLRLHPDALSNEVATVNSEGAYIMRNKAATDAIKTNYKIRATKSNGTEDIFHVLSGGQAVFFLDSGGGNGAVGVTVVPADDTTLVPVFQGLAPDASTRRTVIWQDGSMDIQGTNAARAQLDVLRATGQTASIFRCLDETGANTLFNVTADGGFHSDGSGDLDGGLTVGGATVLNGATTAPVTISTPTSGINHKGVTTGIQNVSATGVIETDQAVSFGVTFPATPRVFVSVNGVVSGMARVNVKAINVTTTGFTIRANTGDGTNMTISNMPVAWMAVAQ